MKEIYIVYVTSGRDGDYSWRVDSAWEQKQKAEERAMLIDEHRNTVLKMPEPIDIELGIITDEMAQTWADWNDAIWDARRQRNAMIKKTILMP